MEHDPSSLEFPHPQRSSFPGCPLRGLLPGLASHSSSDGSRNCTAESPPRKSARLQSSLPFGSPDPFPSVSPAAAASHLLSVCIAASPVAADIGLPSDRPVSLRETASLLAPRWIAA